MLALSDSSYDHVTDQLRRVVAFLTRISITLALAIRAKIWDLDWLNRTACAAYSRWHWAYPASRASEDFSGAFRLLAFSACSQLSVPSLRQRRSASEPSSIKVIAFLQGVAILTLMALNDASLGQGFPILALSLQGHQALSASTLSRP